MVLSCPFFWPPHAVWQCNKISSCDAYRDAVDEIRATAGCLETSSPGCFSYSTWACAHQFGLESDLVRTVIRSASLLILTGRRNGDDGSWSTFSLRIGTPPQIVRLLISTAGQETWAVLPDICNNESSQATCRDSVGTARGLLFNESQSTTWKPQNPSVYDLGLETNLNYTGRGLYGLDTIGLGVDNSSGPALPNQIVAGLVTDEFYVGMLGIGPRPTNFSGFGDPQRSLLETLRDEKLIPSLSWSYTAGAPYRKYVHESFLQKGY
jgi:hypothetical protein